MRRDFTGRKNHSNHHSTGEKAHENSIPPRHLVRLFDHLPVLIWASGPDAKCSYVNQTWLSFTGRTLQQELGDGWAGGIYAEDKGRVLDTYRDAFSTHEPFEIEYRLRHHDGEYRWLHVSGRPFEDENENFAGFIGTCYEITDRKNMEKAFYESEAMFKGLFEYAPDAIIAVDKNGKIMLANQQAQQMFGYTVAELVGQPLEILIPQEFQDRHSQHVSAYMEEPRVRSMGVCLGLLGRRKDGSTLPVDITLGPVEIAEQLFVLANIRDKTERVEAMTALSEREKLLHTAVSAMPITFFVIDRQGIIRLSIGQNLYTLHNPVDIVGRSIDEIYQGSPQIVSNFQRALAGESLMTVVEMDNLILEVRFAPMQNEKGEVTGVASVAIDITSRKQIEAELAELQRRLFDSSEFERLHLAQDLHDGPLQDLLGISFQLNSLKLSFDDQKEASQVGEVQKTLGQVVNELRAICGELRPPSLAPFGLEKAIRSHSEQTAELRPGLNVHLDLMKDGQSLSERVRLALFRIYQHVLMNVVRHSQAQNVYIHFLLDPDWITLEIQDDGKGFELPKRWIDLVREGHFGLVGAIERAEAIGGELKIETHPGRGTMVSVRVPSKTEFQVASRERFSSLIRGIG